MPGLPHIKPVRGKATPFSKERERIYTHYFVGGIALVTKMRAAADDGWVKEARARPVRPKRDNPSTNTRRRAHKAQGVMRRRRPF